MKASKKLVHKGFERFNKKVQNCFRKKIFKKKEKNVEKVLYLECHEVKKLRFDG